MKKISFLLFIVLINIISVKAQLNGYSNREKITITNNTGAVQTNYQVLLKINTKALITAGKMKANGDDIRFAFNCNGSNLANFFIEEAINTDSTLIWLLCPSLPITGTIDAWMFYGNASATGDSNFDSTFTSSTRMIYTAGTPGTLSGATANNYSWFEIPAATTVIITNTQSPVINARRVKITGTLSGNGAGSVGNSNIFVTQNNPGQGASGTAGGGGAYGGAGGRGAKTGTTAQPASGVVHGVANDKSVAFGGGAGATPGSVGGNGGGSLKINATYASVSGSLVLNGANGTADGVTYGGSGGGGGGGLLIDCGKVRFSAGAVCSANGGNGGNASYFIGGGGGGGGRIKIFYDEFNSPITPLVNGGNAGSSAANATAPSEPGIAGTIFTLQNATTTKPAFTLSSAPFLALVSSDADNTICTGNSVTFTASAGAANYAFSKKNGTIITALQSGASNTYTTTSLANNDTVRVVATSGAFCTETAFIKITVSAGITSTFDLGRNSVCQGDTTKVTYTGTASTAGIYTWNFGGAKILSGTGKGPYILRFDTVKSVNITLSINDDGCLSPLTTKSVIVKPVPVADFMLKDSICINKADTITFSGTAPMGSTYIWNFGANATPATANTAGPHIVNWSTIGNKTITLQLIANGCSSVVASKILKVNAVPVASFTTSANSVCAGENNTITFNGTAQANAIYTWSFGANANPATATGTGPFMVNWSSEGTKTISLSVTQNGCSSNIFTKNITVNLKPIAAFTLNSSVCKDSINIISFNGNDGGVGATYIWDFGENATPANANTAGPHNVSWSSLGDKTITLSVINNACTSAVASKVTNVFNCLLPPIANFGGGDTICAGESITYSNLSTNATSFKWSFEGGSPATSTLANPTILYSTPGNYDVELIVNSAGGADTLIKTDNITVNEIPVASFSIPDTTCMSQSTAITFDGVAPANSDYVWNFGSDASPATSNTSGNQATTWSTAGMKVITLQITNQNCVSQLFKDSLEVKACDVVEVLPVANFSANRLEICAGGNIVYTNLSLNATNFEWTFEGGTPATSSDKDPVIQYNTAGIYFVKLKAIKGNKADSISATNYITVNANPIASFSTAAQGCKDSSNMVIFNGTATNGAAYSWSFGEDASPATSSSAGNQNIIYNSVGKKIITLSITQGDCISEIYKDSILIDSCNTPLEELLPKADFDAVIDNSIRKSSFVNQSFNADVYKWTFGDGNTSTAFKPLEAIRHTLYVPLEA